MVELSIRLEQKSVWGLFQEALKTQLAIAVQQRNLEVFTTSYRYIVQILPSLIVAPLYFSHQVELGAISQSYGACMYTNTYHLIIMFLPNRQSTTSWGTSPSSSTSSKPSPPSLLDSPALPLS